MSVFILVKQRTAEEIDPQNTDLPFQTYVQRGELTLQIPAKDQIPRKDGTPSHNYCLYGDLIVTLYDDGTGVCPLYGAELDYLKAVQKPTTRILQYFDTEKMKWIMDLKSNEIVFFKLHIANKAPSLTIKGKVRHYGLLEGHCGVMFGLEIIDPQYKGRGDSDGSPHFHCGYNNAVYVAMDRIIKISQAEKMTPPTIEVEPSVSTRSKTNQSDREEKGLRSKMAEVLLSPGPPTVKPVSSATVHSRFITGDHVVLQPVDSAPIKGIVRWVGPIKTSKETGGVIIPVVGVETDTTLDHERSFPGLSYGLTGSHGHDLFKIDPNHGKIFLAEQVVLSEEEYSKQKEQDNTEEIQEAKKWGLSIEEFKRQEELLSRGNKERDKVFKQRCETLTTTIEQEEEEYTTGRREQRCSEDHRQLHIPTGSNTLQQIIELDTRINTLKSTNTRTVAEKQMATQTVNNLQIENRKVTIENDKLNNEVKSLENRVTQLMSENGRLNNEMTSLGNRVTQLMSENGRFNNEMASLRNRVAQLMSENVALKCSSQGEEGLTDLKYWSVTHTAITTTNTRLGEGGWGKVEVGYFHGQRVAVKMLHSDIISPHYNNLVRREIAMMVKVRHPNLLLCVGAVLDHPSGSPCIITELMDTSVRKAYKDGILDYKMKLCILRDTASALDYLHCHTDEIIHRDVSTANVLLESRGPNKWRAKLSDFGSANIARLSCTTAPGAEVYTAPEVPGVQTIKMDVYSYGVMTCELLTNQFPFRQAFPEMLSILLNNWTIMYDLVCDCTKRAPADRPSMDNIIGILYKNYNDIL